jgi:methylmalonyl-CoA mutase cobalamin-binding domain/chain
MKLALRTQQILAEETGIPYVADPLRGLYYIEALTKRFEDAVWEILAEVDRMGGAINPIERGYFQREIAESAYKAAQRKAGGDQVVIGSNKFVDNADTTAIEVHHVDPEAEARQIARLEATREKRDNERVKQLLDRLEHDAQDTSVNLMPITVELVKARASIGEIVSRLRTVFGVYVEDPAF